MGKHSSCKLIFNIVLCICICFSLGACGNSTVTPLTTTTATTKATTTEPVTLNFGWWKNSPEKEQAFRTWIQSFEKSYPNIKINVEFLDWNIYWDKLSLATVTSQAYDVMGLCSCQAATYFNPNTLLDLNQFSDFGQVKTTLTPDTLQLFNWNSAQYGMPIGIALPVLGYNKQVFKAAGLDFPDPVKPLSFEEFKTLAKKLTKIENGRIVQYALHPGTDRLSWDTWVTMRGGQTFDNYVNPTKMTINTPEGIQGLTDYLSLIQEKIAVSRDDWDKPEWGFGGVGALQTNKVAMTELGTWDFAPTEKQGLPVGVAPFPYAKQSAVRTTANGLGIYKNSKYPQEAWTFIKWSVETANQLEFAKFSDVPVNKKALAQLDTVIQPKEFAPTLLVQIGAFKPTVVTNKTNLVLTLDAITTEMERGFLTPKETALELERKGNLILSGQK